MAWRRLNISQCAQQLLVVAFKPWLNFMNDLTLSVLAYSVENNHDMKLILILLSVVSCCPIQVSILIVVPCLLWKWIIFVPWTPFLIFSTDYNISAWPDLSDAPQIATIAACLDHCIDHLLCCEGIHQHCTLLIGIYSNYPVQNH